MTESTTPRPETTAATATATRAVVRGVGAASALAAVVLGIVSLTVNSSLASVPELHGKVTACAWTAIGFGASAAALLVVVRFLTFRTRNRADTMPFRPVAGAAAAIAAAAALIATVGQAMELRQSETIAFLDVHSSALIGTIACSAAVVAMVCTAFSFGGTAESSPRGAAWTACASLLVWAVSVSLIVTVVPGPPWISTTADADDPPTSRADSIESTAFRLDLDIGQEHVHPTANGFLLTGLGIVTAYNGEDGRHRWKFSFDDVAPPGDSDDDAVAVRDHGREVVVSRGDFTVFLDADTGAVQRRSASPADRARNARRDEMRAFDMIAPFYSLTDDDEPDCVPVPIEVDDVVVRAVCDDRSLLTRNGADGPSTITLDAPSGLSLDGIRRLGNGRIALKYLVPPRNGDESYQPIDVVLIVVDLSSGKELDRFTVTGQGGDIGVSELHGDVVAATGTKSSTLTLRDVSRHRSDVVRLTDEDRQIDPLRSSVLSPIWIGDAVVVPGSTRLTAVDTTRGNHVSLHPSRCISFGSGGVRIVDFVRVPGSVLVQCDGLGGGDARYSYEQLVGLR